MTIRKAEIEDLLTPGQLEHLTRLLVELMAFGFGDLEIGIWDGKVQVFRIKRREKAGEENGSSIA